MTRRILVVLVGFVCMVGAGVIVVHRDVISHLLRGDVFQSSLSAIRECASGRDIIPCSRPFIRDMLRERSADSILTEIERLDLPSNQCHYVAHLVGQELYLELQDTERAIAACTDACNAACAHGVIGEAFRIELGLDEYADLGHLSADEIQTMGQRLCTSRENFRARNMCHGVGHALFLAQKSFESAPICSLIASGEPQIDCYRGLYMEYTDLLSSRSTWQESYDVDFPTIDTLSTLCDRPTPEEVDACFYYFPIAVRQTYRNEGIDEGREKSLLLRVLPLCNSLVAPEKRRACAYGYGATAYEKLISNAGDAVRTCARFSDVTAQDACTAGMFSLALEYSLFEPAIAYCVASDPARKEACYEALFGKVSALSRSIDEIERLCPLDDVLCREGARAAKRDEQSDFH